MNVHAPLISEVCYVFVFRLFLSMNPLHGEISRAMRNRGIEISILPEVRSELLTSPMRGRGSSNRPVCLCVCLLPF